MHTLIFLNGILPLFFSIHFSAGSNDFICRNTFDVKRQVGKLKNLRGFVFLKLSPCRSQSESACPRFQTLTLACAASLWSCWLLACLSLSSRSAWRVAQREVNPSFSSSRASTTCCRSSSSVRLLSVFISWIKEAHARRRAGGHGRPNKQWRLEEMNRKGSHSNREEGKQKRRRNGKGEETRGVAAEMNM